jgi:iron(III) transport system ATP-binding protein
MRLVIEDLEKRFGDSLVLKGVSIEVEDRELFFLLGPSGCGKTTLLRLIAGFYQPDGGRILFGDKPMNGIPPHKRNTGMVFQNYALWPHLTVADNVVYGLDVRAIPAKAKKQRVAQALDIVQMADHAQYYPNQLSGGQQQRVALARALVIEPDLLLLDEPLSNLDAKLRLEMREEIRRIHEQTRITTLYVTHDQKESLSLAGRIAVMKEGGIEQIGPPRQIYRQPSNRFVADFMAETNWLPATVEALGPHYASLATAIGAFNAPLQNALKPGDRVWVGFRPEAVVLAPASTNNIEAGIERVVYLGEIEQYVLKTADGGSIKAFEQNPQAVRQPGMSLHAHVAPENIIVFPRI